MFDPDQTTEVLSDGWLIVQFRADDAREMAWHLYTWGEVEMQEPEEFWGSFE